MISSSDDLDIPSHGAGGDDDIDDDSFLDDTSDYPPYHEMMMARAQLDPPTWMRGSGRGRVAIAFLAAS